MWPWSNQYELVLSPPPHQKRGLLYISTEWRSHKLTFTEYIWPLYRLTRIKSCQSIFISASQFSSIRSICNLTVGSSLTIRRYSSLKMHKRKTITKSTATILNDAVVLMSSCNFHLCGVHVLLHWFVYHAVQSCSTSRPSSVNQMKDTEFFYVVLFSALQVCSIFCAREWNIRLWSFNSAVPFCIIYLLLCCSRWL